MIYIKYFLLLTALFVVRPVLSEQLLKTTKTWSGEDIVYPKGTAEISSHRLIIKSGQITPFHCHPVPTLGYILKGEVEVETKGGEKKRFKKGDSVVEVLRTVHRGKAINGPVEIVVFYVGESHVPNTVFPEDDKAHTYCDE